MNELVLEKTGYDPLVYEDEELFNEQVLPVIKREIQSKQNSSEIANLLGRDESELRLATLNGSIPDSLYQKIVTAAVSEEMDEYIHESREVKREQYTKQNEEFLDKHFTERTDREIIYCSKYTSALVVEATKSEIKALTQDESIESMDYFINSEAKPLMPDALSQVGVYCDNGTGFDVIGGWIAFTGQGVKIGVLETAGNDVGGKFDPTAAQLSGNNKLHFIENIRESGESVPYQIDFHATAVMSVLAGKSVFYDGKTYRGVVPGATVYQTPVEFAADVYTGIDTLIQYDVSVINISLGIPDDSLRYHYLEQYIDGLQEDYDVTIVVSAGNEGKDNGNSYITSPGNALNAITVGNAETKTREGTLLDEPYNVFVESSYVESNYLPNKPDIVAPGCFFLLEKIGDYGIDYLDYYDYYIFGTSVAAPIVAGIAAQLHQAIPYYRTNSLRTKAALLVGADLSKMNLETDIVNNPHFYGKCGAGMVNAINSMTDVSHISLGEADDYAISTDLIYCEEGQRMRAVLAFNKKNDKLITAYSDLDNLTFYLMKQNGVYVAYSASPRNNNEFIDITIPEDGYYYFKVYTSISDETCPPEATIAYRLIDE